MLYDLNWLNRGRAFPPPAEAERLKTYSDNRKLFNGDVEQVLAPYRARVQNIQNRFADVNGMGDSYVMELNYFQLVTLKTGDLVCGDPPTITIDGKSGETDALRGYTLFDSKLLEAVYDASRLGDSIARVVKDGRGRGNFVIVSPDMWFPIVNRENHREIVQHVLAWVEDVTLPIQAAGGKREYILRTQIHDCGYYMRQTYRIDDYEGEKQYVTPYGLNVSTPSYKIGEKLSEEEVPTGLDDFAIVPLQNVTMPDSVYAINDYDRITAIIAELQVRYALESLILDKHSAPTMYVPNSALKQNRTGEWTFTPGGVIPVKDGDQLPGYLVWDAALEANHRMIEKLEKHLYSLCEMGAVIDDDSFGASQGFEALETRMTNARLKARRLSSRLTEPVKKLLELISELSGERLEADKITVNWNDGLPENEFREADIALKKQPFFATKSLLREHFGKTEGDAEQEVEERRREQADNFGGGFAVGVGGENEEEGADV